MSWKEDRGYDHNPRAKGLFSKPNLETCTAS